MDRQSTLERPPHILGWVLLGLVGAALLRSGFPVLFPLYPPEWSTAHHEAEAIAFERLRDLGGEPREDSSGTRLEVDGVLERRLLNALETAPPDVRLEILGSELSDRVLRWTIKTFDPTSAGDQWDHRAVVSASGRVWALERRVPLGDGEGGAGQIFPGEARLEARQFLEEQGFDLAEYADPVVLRRTWPSRVDLSLRYEKRDPLWQGDLSHGLEVRYVGGTLQGFSSWVEDRHAGGIERSLGVWQSAFVVRRMLFLPALIAVVAFGRRRRKSSGDGAPGDGAPGDSAAGAWRVFVLIVLAGGFVVANTLHGATEGWLVGEWSRRQIALGWAAVMCLIFVPAFGLLGTSSWFSVGRYGSEWSSRLDSMRDLLELRWSDAGVGSSCLRGSAAGLFLAGALVTLIRGLDSLGASTQLGFVFGPWWMHGRWPGLTLSAFTVASSVSLLLFALLFVLPRAVAGLGSWVGGTVVAILLGALVGSPLAVMPTAFSFPLWALSGALWVTLFLRYDLLSAAVAAVVSTVSVASLTFLHAQDSTLQAQGWFALALALLPLVVSARYIGGSAGNAE